MKELKFGHAIMPVSFISVRMTCFVFNHLNWIYNSFENRVPLKATEFLMLVILSFLKSKFLANRVSFDKVYCIRKPKWDTFFSQFQNVTSP